jgi:hypothetical protein
VKNILHPAPPAHDPENLDIGVMGQDIFGQMTPGKPGDSRNQDSHSSSMLSSQKKMAYFLSR